ncbi:MAG: amino acid permease [Alphaproteobacteria bacterium]
MSDVAPRIVTEGVGPATGEIELRRALGPVQLILLGIGMIIGAGIFVITGHAAAAHAGPAIVLSFVLAGTACLFAALCYAEFASMIPVAGSAYTYAYATLGSFMAWFIGWNLVLEYMVAAATVAVGWSGYFTDLMRNVGILIPEILDRAPVAISSTHEVSFTGSLINVPAAVIVLLLTSVLVVGVRESATFNGLMVLIKVAVVIAVIVFGLSFVEMDNLTPFIPPNEGTFGKFGFSGVLTGAAIIFFAYIGFDGVSVAAQEARNPQRDMPIGILGSLLVCTVLYILMSVVLTGIVPYQDLSSTLTAHPVSTAMASIPGLSWLSPIVNVGATVGLASVIFVSLYGQSRIFYAMSRDGFIPKLFSEVHPRYRTPWRGTIIVGIFAAALAAVFPLDILGELVSIGTLLAFAVVCLGILVLRVQRPKAKRHFRTPYAWVVAPLGVLSCGALMYALPAGTWVRLIVWTAIGFLIYFLYGIWHIRKPQWKIEE